MSWSTCSSSSSSAATAAAAAAASSSSSSSSSSSASDSSLFSFPFTPYPQQRRLMHSVFECLESSSLGLFESPTGTGKSLSVICASMSWLQKEELRILTEAQTETETQTQSLTKAQAQAQIHTQKQTESEPEGDWLAAYLLQGSGSVKKATSYSGTTTTSSSECVPSSKQQEQKVKDALKRYNAIVEEISQSRNGRKGSSNRKPIALSGFQVGRSLTSATQLLEDEKKKKVSDAQIGDGDQDDFALAPYDSGEEGKDATHEESDESCDENDDISDPWEILKLPQIYYCSRTHTQLSQFAAEIKKTAFANVRCVILGSRKTSCINPLVSKLKSDFSINEKCLDLQRKSSNKSTTTNKKQAIDRGLLQTSCTYHQLSKEKKLATVLLNDIHDVEDVLRLGNEHSACPYYASRRSIRRAQVVCMPYSTLFHSDVRESMGLSLNNRIIIIDEAHNLVETLNQLYSTDLTYGHVMRSFKMLNLYLNRFQTILHGKNLFYLNILNTIIKKLKAVMEGKVVASNNAPMTNNEKVVSVNTFVFEASLDNINMIKLKKFLLSTNMVNRIGGYSESVSVNLPTTAMPPCEKQSETTTSKSDLRALINFIVSLTNQDDHGRVVVKNVGLDRSDVEDEPVLKYVMLHAAGTFRPILEQARSVILLGGTMQPFPYFTSMLFPTVPSSRLRIFSCNHIVDQSHVIARIIGRSPVTKEALEITHNRRMAMQCTSDLFEIILGLSKVIPKGIVVFFTSYQYLALVHSRWASSGTLQELAKHKDIFVESKGQSTDLLWEKYCKAAQLRNGSGKKGAILFSVIGGRLSEGINFSDDLARGVVVVGMPYPDTRDVILQEKMKYLSSCQQNGETSSTGNYAENMCMKAVNQAIGRSIRHAQDYASIVLIDNRYNQTKIKNQLPGWIQQSLTSVETEQCLSDLTAFFREK